jgi:hypothetical protein
MKVLQDTKLAHITTSLCGNLDRKWKNPTKTCRQHNVLYFQTCMCCICSQPPRGCSLHGALTMIPSTIWPVHRCSLHGSRGHIHQINKWNPMKFEWYGKPSNTNLPFGDDFHNPFMAASGMIVYWVLPCSFFLDSNSISRWQFTTCTLLGLIWFEIQYLMKWFF